MDEQEEREYIILHGELEWEKDKVFSSA